MFNYGRDRIRHIYVFHERDKLPFQCKECPYAADRQREFTAHMYQKHGEGFLKKKLKAEAKLKADFLVKKRVYTKRRSKDLPKTNEQSNSEKESDEKSDSDDDDRIPVNHISVLDADPPEKQGLSSSRFRLSFKQEDGQTVKIYKCDQCQFSTSCHKGILQHYRTHTGEKPYKERFIGFFSKFQIKYFNLLNKI